MNQSFVLANRPQICGYASVVGDKEGKGRYGSLYDKVIDDNGITEKSWEKSESFLVTTAVDTVIKKSGIPQNQLSYIIGGDLLNQCIGTTFGIKELEVPFLGVYGACSTMSESLMLSSMLINANYGSYALAVTSSHFCSAERQFRFPLEYGGQRSPAAQWTVTGSGAVIVGGTQGKACVSQVTIGKIVDKGIVDTSNMGAAMAPAFVDTIIACFNGDHALVESCDLIVTGDLGKVGIEIANELLLQSGLDITDKLFDCGANIFLESQDVQAGGSGCGCAASVLCAHLLPRIESGEVKRILFCATGALHSPTSALQGDTIPAISHAVAIEHIDN